MTSTSTSQGYSLQRNSSKVIQPPGGRTADIFGRSVQDDATSNKTNPQPTHQQSNAPYADEVPIRNPEPEAVAAEPQADPQPLVTSDDFKPVQQTAPAVPRGQEPGAKGAGGNASHDASTTSKKHFQQQRRNPITGEIITDQPAQAAVVRVRQPPGGRSSGIF